VMDQTQLRLELLKLAFHPAKEVEVCIQTAKILEEYCLGQMMETESADNHRDKKSGKKSKIGNLEGLL